MAESEQHIIYVRHLFCWVRDNLLAGDAGIIYADLPEAKKHSKPLSLQLGVRPDLYAVRGNDNLLIIGEAKTAPDLETRHSIMQYEFYIVECERHLGPALIVMAVPWFAQRTARNLLISLIKKKRASKTQLLVLEKLPG